MSRIDERWAANRPALEEAARNAGVDVGVMVRIAGFESKFNPDARPVASNPDRNTVTQYDGTKAISSAHGLGQFLNSTWQDMINRHGEKYGVDNAAQLTRAQANAPALREDVRLQAAMLAEFTRENIDQAARYGGKDVDANVYAMHNLGGSDGPRFLQALRNNPDARVDSVLSRDVISGNGSLYDDGSISLRQAYANMGAQMDAYDRYAQEALRGQPSGSISAGGPVRAAAGATANPAADGVLSLNESGAAVKQLQERLAALGYTDAQGKPLAADSVYGANTRHAVERFQHDRGLAVDGVAGRHTLEALQGQHSQRNAAAPHRFDPNGPQLQENSRGTDVRALQEALVRMGYADRGGQALAVDGIFGPRTEAGVRAFQQDHGLRADGIVGPLSRAALNQSGNTAQVRAANGEHAHGEGGGSFLSSLFDAARSGKPDAFRDAMANLADSPVGRAFNQMHDEVQQRLASREAEKPQPGQGQQQGER